MRAYRLEQWGATPRLGEVARPELVGTDDVLVRVEATGICHSDLHLVDGAAAPSIEYRLPFTLGHEIAGTVAASSRSASELEVGQRVAVYGPWGCGTCAACARAEENLCTERKRLRYDGCGLGTDGGFADYVRVPHHRYLVPVGDAPAEAIAPLTDAGLTAFHAVGKCIRGTAPSTVLVIGVGGIGHLAIQLLTGLRGARVVALDVREDALRLATKCGADVALHVEDATSHVLRSASGPPGYDAVLDFVGSPDSLLTANKAVRSGGNVVLVGIGGGSIPFGYDHVRREVTLTTSYWGSISELRAVVEAYERGLVRPEVEVFRLADVETGFEAVRTGAIMGRAVVVP